MASEMLLKTLNETLREITEEANSADVQEGDRRADCERARAQLEAAERRLKQAAFEADEARKSYRELLDFHNSQPEKLQVIAEKLNRLVQRQSEAVGRQNDATVLRDEARITYQESERQHAFAKDERAKLVVKRQQILSEIDRAHHS